MAERIRWSGYEFEYKEKTADWFWAVGIIVVSLAAISIISLVKFQPERNI